MPQFTLALTGNVGRNNIFYFQNIFSLSRMHQERTYGTKFRNQCKQYTINRWKYACLNNDRKKKLQ